MATYANSQLTSAGLLLASRAAAGKTTFSLTRTTASSKDLSTVSVGELTAMPDEMQSGVLTDNSIVRLDDHTLKQVEVFFTNRDLEISYPVNAIGIYAKETGGSEILYAVIKAVEAEMMPSFADKVLLEFKLAVTVVVGQIQNVTVAVDPNGLATTTYVQNQQVAVVLNEKSYAIDTAKLNLNDYPGFKAWGYYNGAGIAQTTSYAGVPLMTELTMNVDLQNNGQVMIPRFMTAQIKAALPDFNIGSFAVTRASDGKWMYLISEPATIGIQCLNATFK
ncbi:hypothetical protein ACR79V_08395 [Lactiplantibacillus plantarum]